MRFRGPKTANGLMFWHGLELRLWFRSRHHNAGRTSEPPCARRLRQQRLEERMRGRSIGWRPALQSIGAEQVVRVGQPRGIMIGRAGVELARF